MDIYMYSRTATQQNEEETAMITEYCLVAYGVSNSKEFPNFTLSKY